MISVESMVQWLRRSDVFIEKRNICILGSVGTSCIIRFLPIKLYAIPGFSDLSFGSLGL